MVVAAVALLVGALLNAERIDATAHGQPYGWQRTWAVRATGPLASLSRATGLNLPRRALSAAAGNELPPPPAADTRTGAVVTVAPTTPEAPTGTTTTTTEPLDLRSPTPADPLRVLVVGDSLMGFVGAAIARDLDGAPITIVEEWEVGTGLARPDVVNWPARLAEIMTAEDPEVVVLGFGANDNQDLTTGDGAIGLGSPEWRDEYQRRVAQVLAVVEGEGRSVYWLGLPVTDRPDIEAVAPLVADATTTEVSARPWATYLDTRDALAPDGTYTAYLPDGSGGRVKVRADDGVHPNLAGARRMVAPLVAALVAERDLG